MAVFNLEGGIARAQSNLCDSPMVLARPEGDSVMVDAQALRNQRGSRTLSWDPRLALTVHPSSAPIAIRVPVPYSSSPPDSATRRRIRDSTPRGSRDTSRHPSSSRIVVRQADTNLSEAISVIHELETELNQARA